MHEAAMGSVMAMAFAALVVVIVVLSLVALGLVGRAWLSCA
jgi:hypothetical protein